MVKRLKRPPIPPKRRRFAEAMFATIFRVRIKGEGPAFPKVLEEARRMEEECRRYGIDFDREEYLRLWGEYDEAEEPERSKVYNKIEEFVLKIMREFHKKEP